MQQKTEAEDIIVLKASFQLAFIFYLHSQRKCECKCHHWHLWHLFLITTSLSCVPFHQHFVVEYDGPIRDGLRYQKEVPLCLLPLFYLFYILHRN